MLTVSVCEYEYLCLSIFEKLQINEKTMTTTKKIFFFQFGSSHMDAVIIPANEQRT